MRSPDRIAVKRIWTERHAHKNLRLAEDEQGRIWLRIDDLRQWMPGLHKTEHLMQRHPGMIRLADSTSRPYLEASTFAWLTQKSTSDATLKLSAWLEANVVGQAQRRHSWDAYKGEQHLGISDRLLSADTLGGQPSSAKAMANHLTGKMSVDPRVWMITLGEWGILSTLCAGFAFSLLGVFASIVLEQVAWDVRNSYVFWTWMAIASAAWAIVWNAAWIIGAIRSSIRRIHEGLHPWLASSAMLTSLFCAISMAFYTIQNTSLLLDTWWAIYGQRDRPVSVLVTRVDDLGSPARLRMTGRVGIGSYKALNTALQRFPSVKEIELNSPGGLTLEGFAMTDLLAAAGLTTIVRDGCHSVCAHMFLAGSRRLVTSDAEVGFHPSSNIVGPVSDELSTTDLRMAKWMQERGVRADFIQQALDTPGGEIFIESTGELVRAGVATAIVEDL